MLMLLINVMHLIILTFQNFFVNYVQIASSMNKTGDVLPERSLPLVVFWSKTFYILIIEIENCPS